MSAVAFHLKALNIQHRFILSGSCQQLILFDKDDLHPVANVLARWEAGHLATRIAGQSGPVLRLRNKPAPLTLLLIFLGFMGAALAGFGREFIDPFTFWNFSVVSPFNFNPWIDIQNGQVWRLVTPVFLHFGPVHIIFNALWVWYLGTILELNQGRLMTLALVLVISIVSNTAQAFVSDGAIFGGLSGVVHGLFAYCWLWGKMHKGSPVRLPDALFVVITAIMLLSPLGIFDIIVGGEIADTAHISGYITGLFCALAVYFLDFSFLKSER